MVFLSSRISPFTSTVIFFERSPAATAFVTSAMFRTWPVRFDAMKFTESVRSFQVPATPCTSAWPPRRPSVPTSRATRVTSEAKERSWSTIVLMVFLSSRISPFTSTVIFLDRSPLATAVVTAAMLRTCEVRLPAIEFTESVRSFQVPATPFTFACPPSLPSVPTSRATRVTSAANDESWSTIVLMVFFNSRISPFTSTVIFRETSPRATAVVTSAMLRTLPVRLWPIEIHPLPPRGPLLPRPGHPLPLRLPAELSFRSHFPRDARHFRGERAELVHHLVDRLRRAQEFSLQRAVVDLQGHRLRKVALGDRADHPRRFTGRVHEVVDERVNRHDRIAPEAAHVAHLRALLQLAFLAHLLPQRRQLLDDALVQLHHFVERLGDLAVHAVPRDRQAHRAVPPL